jgi:ribosomal protein L10
LVKRVLGDLKAEGDMPELPGELAIAYGDDLLAPARETYAFQKTPRDKGSISIVGGIFDGVFKTQAEMMSIATIPSLQVLRGQFVNLINSPIQRLAIVLDEIRKSKEAVSGAVAKVEIAVAAVVEKTAETIAEVVEAPTAPEAEATA